MSDYNRNLFATDRNPEEEARDQVVQELDNLETFRESDTREFKEFLTDSTHEAEAARIAVQQRKDQEKFLLKSSEEEIQDANARYQTALMSHYDLGDPFGSLARAAMAEFGLMIQKYESLGGKINREKDKTARRILELLQTICIVDYMGVTSRRIANQKSAIYGSEDNHWTREYRRLAMGYAAQSIIFQKEYRELKTTPPPQNKIEVPPKPSDGGMGERELYPGYSRPIDSREKKRTRSYER